jgi:putative DNA primase/helicase
MSLAPFRQPVRQPPDIAGYELSDLGLGTFFADLNRRRAMYCYALERWFTWNGRYWREDDGAGLDALAAEAVRRYGELAAAMPGEDARKQHLRFAARIQSGRALREMVRQAQHQLCVRADQLDQHDGLLCVENGVIDLGTGQLLSHDPDLLLTACVPCGFDPDAFSATWQRVVSRALSGDEQRIAFLQRAIGAALRGGNPDERLFLVDGPEASSKSTVQDALYSTFRPYSVILNFESLLERRDVGGARPDLAQLRGKRLAFSNEVRDGRKLAEELVKSLAGADVIKVRALYQAPIEFRVQASFFLFCNTPPRARGDDGALWRRLLRLSFPNSLPEHERDPRVKEELRDIARSGPGILAWAVKGALAWRAHGLEVPDAVRAETAEYRDSQDPLRNFLDDCAILDAPFWTSSAELRRAYERWCERVGEHPLRSTRAFAAALKHHECEQDKRLGERGWRGIALREDAE